MIVQIQHRRGTAAEFAATNPVLKSGEWGYDTTNKVVKIGDGVTPWTSLAGPFASDTYTRAQADARYLQRSGTSFDNYQAAEAEALRPFWSAYANAEYAATDILFLGTSHTEGEGATRHGRQFVAKFHDRLRARRAITGVAGARAGYSFIPAGFSFDKPDTPIAVGAGVTTNSFSGFGFKNAELEANETFTFSTGSATSVALVIRQSTTTSSVSVRVDGGTANTVGTSTTGAPNQFLRIQTVAMLGLGGTTHTVTITGVQGISYILGLQVFNNDETVGLRTYNTGRNGIKASDYAAPSTALDGLSTIRPSLMFLEFGHNDLAAAGRTAAQFKADLMTIIDKSKTLIARPASYGLIGMYPQGDGLGGVRSEWAGYNTVMKEIAEADTSVFFVDLWARYLNAAQSSNPNARDLYGLVGSDNMHMTDAGHSLAADILVSAVVPR